MQIVSERLIGCRKNLGLTQEELAEKTGFSLRSIQHWENGIHEPHGENLRKLASFFKQDVAYFHERTGVLKEGKPTSLPTPREKSHCHIDRVFDECEGDLEKEAWVFVELSRRFPVSSAVDRVVKKMAEADIAEIHAARTRDRAKSTMPGASNSGQARGARPESNPESDSPAPPVK